ncbi:primase homolog protein isoform X2 [Morus notabilis]|uniref:primase homolog protein isoform X2 n=1 Tax=Morus notabilis TaxID=981085 RepID=UPI000CED7EC1|nr:primase homolog protein isoform X2 [Morus notabilis]
MRINSAIQSLCHPTNTAILFPRRKLSNLCCFSSSQSNNLQSSTKVPAKLEQVDERSTVNVAKVNVLKQKVEILGIIYDSSMPGRYYNLSCPKCKGGKSMERSLSFHIVQNGDFAMWRCFRFDCGWAGRVFAEDRAKDDGTKRKFKSTRELTEESLGLVPLGEELIIAFTYRKNGLLVSCKYRTLEKRFWQEKDTEKVLYGLHDIIDTDEIIIVEGELDKLSVEEAGLRNCVSVPGGAPGKVSDKLPSFEKDTAFRYLWNCKQYLDKASRIVLATDGDTPGQALAEELARRLGKERCWRVSWPKKDEYSYFKDANEVLRCMGPSALKNIIENAELYHQSMADQQMKDI